MSSDSPENHPSSFPPLLKALVFILLEDGGVVAITQIKEELSTLHRKLRAEEKIRTTDCLCENSS